MISKTQSLKAYHDLPASPPRLSTADHARLEANNQEVCQFPSTQMRRRKTLYRQADRRPEDSFSTTCLKTVVAASISPINPFSMQSSSSTRKKKCKMHLANAAPIHASIRLEPERKKAFPRSCQLARFQVQTAVSYAASADTYGVFELVQLPRGPKEAKLVTTSLQPYSLRDPTPSPSSSLHLVSGHLKD